MPPLIEYLLGIKIIVILAWGAMIFALEYFSPYCKNPFKGRENIKRIGKNIGLWAINSLLSPILIIPISLFAANHGLQWRADIFSLTDGHIAIILMDIILLEFFIYWWHRANHQSAFLWRFHQVHHLDEFLDITTAVRFHFGEVILSAFARGAYIIILDISFTAVLLGEALLLLASIFQHSNITINEKLDKLLQYIIVTPNWHWMHHHAIRKDTDSNYGNFLTIWDRLFSSACKNKRRKDMKIGIEKTKDKGFYHILILPFKQTIK